jgi:hypothetical protein
VVGKFKAVIDVETKEAHDIYE